MGDGIANNDSVLTLRISGVINLEVNSLSITDLTGIEDFDLLDTLICNNNQISNLDVTSNLALTYLNCGQNNLANLNLTQNTSLSTLYCFNNQLTNLDVTQNSALIFLGC